MRVSFIFYNNRTFIIAISTLVPIIQLKSNDISDKSGYWGIIRQ